MAPKRKALSVPELVPSPLWGRSASKMLGTRAVWKKQIRGNALAQANNRCEVCAADAILQDMQSQYQTSPVARRRRLATQRTPCARRRCNRGRFQRGTGFRDRGQHSGQRNELPERRFFRSRQSGQRCLQPDDADDQQHPPAASRTRKRPVTVSRQTSNLPSNHADSGFGRNDLLVCGIDLI